MMASMMDLPKEGHFDTIYHIFAYLKVHHNSELILDPTVSDSDNRNSFQDKIGQMHHITSPENQSLKTPHRYKDKDLQ